MNKIKQYYINNNWAVSSDDIQWILQKRRNDGRWVNICFVRSDKEVLERCMRDYGVPVEDSIILLSELSETFDKWMATHVPVNENNA